MRTVKVLEIPRHRINVIKLNYKHRKKSLCSSGNIVGGFKRRSYNKFYAFIFVTCGKTTIKYCNVDTKMGDLFRNRKEENKIRFFFDSKEQRDWNQIANSKAHRIELGQ